MKVYDIAVIGAGPAGCMAAIQGASKGKKVILIEKNDKIGRKLRLTAQGRCNFTNSAPLEAFMENFGKRGSFYRDAFTKFSNHRLIDFFKSHGLQSKEEDEGRIFPVTENALDVVKILKKELDKKNVKIKYNFPIKNLKKRSAYYVLDANDQLLKAFNVVLATGGESYSYTGSTGDGIKIAKKLGHHIRKQTPGGIPLITGEGWTHKLKGVTLENVGMSIEYNGRLMRLPHGNLLLTHFGVSGPVILDISNILVEVMEEFGDLKLLIDLKKNIKKEDLEVLLVEDFKKYSKKNLKNYLKYQLIDSLIEPLLDIISLDPNKKLNQITKKERLELIIVLKALPLTITGHLPLNKALVTCGGVSKKEINPKTMESKIAPGLYFAGEIISGCGHRGGYNLQQAFSTGYLAGNAASQK